MFFDLVAPFVINELQSFFSGKSLFAVEREMRERFPVTGRIEWMPALGRLEKGD